MKTKRFAALVLAVALTLSMAGCGGSSGALGSKNGQSGGVLNGQTGAVITAVSNRPNLLAENYTPLADLSLAPCVAEYTVQPDLGNVINGDDYSYMSDAFRRQLAANGFVVSTAYSRNEFYELYEMNRYGYTPNFITVDSMLHSYHLYFSYLLRSLEGGQLSERLRSLSGTMLALSAAQLDALAGTEWEAAAARNTAFFAVGCNLIDPQGGWSVPDAAAGLVQQELALINAASDMTASPILSAGAGNAVTEDYTQYIPRGYYTASEALSRYFRAMMWYGRANFAQSDESLDRSALLMTLALEDPSARSDWEAVYNLTSFFAGASDDAGRYEYLPLIEEAYNGVPAAGDLAGSDAGWQAFHQLTGKLVPPAINSMPIGEGDDVEEKTKGYRFMGQRFTMDAAIFQQLVYRNVEKAADGRQRMLPSGLDLAAALGSDEALTALRETGDIDYPNYDSQMQMVRDAAAAAPDSLWTASLYGGWLNMITPLLQEKGEGYPMFMRGQAWARKCISSFLGSWTELKHDTVLYSKQVYAEMGGGEIEPEDDRGYVEPEPLVFDRLSNLASATAAGLRQYGVLTDAQGESLGRMADLAAKLCDISQKELQDVTLTEEEYELIRCYGGELEHFWIEAVSDQATSEYFSPMEMPGALVADVATDPDGGRVLEEGTAAYEIYVVVSVGGSLRVATGVVFGYYEFTQPMSERLTDKQWQRMLGMNDYDDNGNYSPYEGEYPRLPVWTDCYTMKNVWE